MKEGDGEGGGGKERCKGRETNTEVVVRFIHSSSEREVERWKERREVGEMEAMYSCG